MDELNLASRLAGGEDERPAPRGRGKLKRIRKKGVGMEKPTDVEIPEEEEETPDREGLPPLDLEAFGGPAPEDEEMEEDETFRDLVDRMEGGSASMGRANARRAKLKGRRPVPRKDEDEE